jgi:hypothetical protein
MVVAAARLPPHARSLSTFTYQRTQTYRRSSVEHSDATAEHGTSKPATAAPGALDELPAGSLASPSSKSSAH